MVDDKFQVRSVGLSVCLSVGLFDCGWAGLFVRWSVGLSVCRSVGPLIGRSIIMCFFRADVLVLCLLAEAEG